MQALSSVKFGVYSGDYIREQKNFTDPLPESMSLCFIGDEAQQEARDLIDFVERHPEVLPEGTAGFDEGANRVIYLEGLDDKVRVALFPKNIKQDANKIEGFFYRFKEALKQAGVVLEEGQPLQLPKEASTIVEDDFSNAITLQARRPPFYKRWFSNWF